MMTNQLLCCDWGTSSFRLRLLNKSDFRSIGEVLSPAGIASTFDNWQRIGGNNTLTRDQFFRQQIKTQIDLLADTLSADLTGIPVVISGMASSSIGMAEIPYATLPFALDGSQARVQQFDPSADFPHACLLISGVKSQQDVMRGEETQLIGLVALLKQSSDKMNDAIFIFPGTHSKHMQIQNGQLVRFDTYMTGEVFDLMTKQSILKDSINTSDLTNPSFDDISAFKSGVRQSKSSTILNNLFTVRTNQLFGKFSKRENAFYVSGLLIGTELNHLRQNETCPFVLCSGSNLAAFYELAIDELNLTTRTRLIATELIDRVASVGQLIVWQNHMLNSPIS